MNSINYVKNPKTNRPVKVGSRVWRDLVKEGALSAENFVDEKELYELKPEDNPDQVIEELDRELPYNVQAVRGRGKYQGKIIKRDKPFDNLEQTVQVVKKASVQACKQMPEVTSDNEEDWESALESMIMSELVKPKNAPKLKLSEVKKGGMIYPRSGVGLTNKKPVKKEEVESDFEEVQDNDDESSNVESSDY